MAMSASRRYVAMSLAAFFIALSVFAGLLYWQDARVTAASARSHLDTVQLTQRLVEAQDSRDLGARAELIADNQAVTGYISAALGTPLPVMAADPP